MRLYGHFINQTARNFVKTLNERISPLGLYSSQWGVILFLGAEGKSTQRQISDYLRVEAPTMTRTITRMEKEGLITKTSGEDRRTRYITLTEKANELYGEWLHASDKMENQAIEGISAEDLETFLRVLETMNTNLDKR
ncbi:MarR family winged helix-turn-helix transcriptional regulator [Salicibibacter kimchii]|uniref:MarR family transcriptional regulator n=1 Tax=Salicibibacter kimchii TaxID=2099786 RepID=A0A345BUF2_9BACI|nr:MarR family transcriptional regulator [Salicibibacter kimchii]AXF54583.1 MarR family transcriptional regulator [Salicibibacter kimchii]